jgi:predicted transposase/invertase (TIGR01784 family)
MAATNDKTQAPNTEKQGQRHDEGYKYILSNAVNFLHFLKKYFAAPWMTDISVDDIEPVNKSYITKEYRRVDSDLIYKLKRGNADIYFYVLLELQSKVDYTMVFRLLRYMVELLNDIFQNTDKNVRERKDFRLPAIVPIVLYDGNRRWTAAKSFKEYTKDYEIFGDNIINFEYLLLDLNRTADSEILPVSKLLDAAFSLAKMRFEKKLSPEEIKTWWAEQALNLSKDDVLELADWMLLAFKAPPKIKKMLQDTLMKGDGATMKTGIELFAEAFVDERKHEEALRIADRLKTMGMSVEDIAKATGLTVDEILQL